MLPTLKLGAGVFGDAQVTLGSKIPSSVKNHSSTTVFAHKFVPTSAFDCSRLEDNDPSGYQSKRALATKASKNIRQFKIPKRSPDLTVIDYFVWSEVERRMRTMERAWPNTRHETRQQYIRRLRAAVRSIPANVIDKAIGDLARRAELLYRARGGLFDESKEVN